MSAIVKPLFSILGYFALTFDFPVSYLSSARHGTPLTIAFARNAFIHDQRWSMG
jgi:hypothetical protein